MPRNFAHITALLNPVSRETVRCFVPAGKPLQDVLQIPGAVRIQLNGGPYEGQALRSGDMVLLTAPPAGTTEERKDGARISMLIAAQLTAAYFTGGMSLWAQAGIQVGVSLGTNWLANTLIPPTSGGLQEGEEFIRLGALTGTRNRVQPNGVVPRVYGHRKLFPPMSARPFTEIIGSKQYLRMLFNLGPGPLHLSNPRIGESLIGTFDAQNQFTPSELFEEVEIEVGENPGLYTNQVAQENPGSVFIAPNDSDVRQAGAGADELSVDFVFPQGLFAVTEKNRTVDWGVNMHVYYREIGSGTWLTVTDSIATTEGFAGYFPAQQRWSTNSSDKRETYRCSLRWKVDREKQYEIQVVRSTAGSTAPSYTQSFDQMVWDVLRWVTYERPTNMPGTVQLTIRIRASDQLSGVLDNFSLEAQSRLWVSPNGEDWNFTFFDPDTGAGSGGAITANPAWILANLLTDPNVNARPLPINRLDAASFKDWADTCAAEGRTCNMVMDNFRTVLQAAAIIGEAGRGALTIRDGKYAVIQDKHETVPVQHFTPRNSWDFSGTRDFPEIPHALRVIFANQEEGWQPDEALVFDDGYSEDGTNCQFDDGTGICKVATKFEELDLSATVTSWPRAWKEGRTRLAEARLRPEQYTWYADIEHIVCERGDQVLVSHDITLWGLASGRIKSVNAGANVVTLDEQVTMEAGKTYNLRMRANNGDSLLRTVTVSAGTHNEITLDDVSGIAAGDLFMFGETGAETQSLKILSVEPQGDFTARITAVDASPVIHDADQGTIPPFDSNISAPPIDIERLRPQAPIIDRVRTGGNILYPDGDRSPHMRITVDFSLQPGVLADTVEGRYRRVDDPGGWTGYETVDASAGTIALRDVEVGGTYEIQIRARRGVMTSPWTQFGQPLLVLGKGEGPEALLGFSAVIDKVHIRLEWDPPEAEDIYAFEIRKGATWGSSVFVAKVFTTSHLDKITEAGDITYWVAAIDTSRNTGVPVSGQVTVTERYLNDPNFGLTTQFTVRLGPFNTTGNNYPVYMDWAGDVNARSMRWESANAGFSDPNPFDPEPDPGNLSNIVDARSGQGLLIGTVNQGQALHVRAAGFDEPGGVGNDGGMYRSMVIGPERMTTQQLDLDELDSRYLQIAGNLSDIAAPSTARLNLGLGALAVLHSVDTAQINNAAVTFVKIQDLPGTSILGRPGSNAGVSSAITAGANAQVLHRNNGVLEFGLLGHASVTFANQNLLTTSDVVFNQIQVASSIIKAPAALRFEQVGSTALRQINIAQASAITHAVAAGRTLQLQGTTNQVIINNTGALNLTGNRSWTLSLPQDIHTGASPAFQALSTTVNITVGTDISIGQHLSIAGNATFSNTSSLGSSTLVRSFAGSGWVVEHVNGEYRAWVDQLNVRGSLSVYEMMIERIRGGNSSFLFSDGVHVVEIVEKNPDEYRFFIAEDTLMTLQSGDLVRAQAWTGRSVYNIRTWVDATGTLSGRDYFDAFKQDTTGLVEVDHLGEKAFDFFRVGSSNNAARRGSVFITASMDGPHIAVNDEVSTHTAWGTPATIKAWLGDLSPLTISGINLQGYGLYSENSYLTGELLVGDLSETEGFLKFSSSGLFVNARNFDLEAANGDHWRTATNAFRFGGANGIAYTGSGNIIIGTGASFAGTLTAPTGIIADFTLLSDRIISHNSAGANRFGLRRAGGAADIFIFGGFDGHAGTASDFSTALFYVRNDGFLKASNAEITGNITANTGSIGGFTIAENWISSGGLRIAGGGTPAIHLREAFEDAILIDDTSDTNILLRTSGLLTSGFFAPFYSGSGTWAIANIDAQLGADPVRVEQFQFTVPADESGDEYTVQCQVEAWIQGFDPQSTLQETPNLDAGWETITERVWVSADIHYPPYGGGSSQDAFSISAWASLPSFVKVSRQGRFTDYRIMFYQQSLDPRYAVTSMRKRNILHTTRMNKATFGARDVNAYSKVQIFRETDEDTRVSLKVRKSEFAQDVFVDLVAEFYLNDQFFKEVVLSSPEAGEASWGDITGKPFTSIGNSLTVSGGTLNVRNITALSVTGRGANSSGLIQDITAALDYQVLRRSGAALGFGAINLASSNAVTGTLAYTNLPISATQVSNWDTAHSWGNHAAVGYLTSVSWGEVTGKPSTFPPSSHSHPFSDLPSINARSVVGRTGTPGTIAQITSSVSHGVLRDTGSGSIGWGAVNLASSNAVTGRLPFSNVVQVSAGLRVLGRSGASGGDISEISASSTHQVLRVGADTTLSFGAINLASSNAVTGSLPYTNAAFADQNLLITSTPEFSGLNLNVVSTTGAQAVSTIRQTTNPKSGSTVVLANLGVDLRQDSTSTGHAAGLKFTVGNADSYTGTAAIIAERTGSWSEGALHFAVNNSGSSGKTDIPIMMTIDGPLNRTSVFTQLQTEGSRRIKTRAADMIDSPILINDNDEMIFIDDVFPSLSGTVRLPAASSRSGQLHHIKFIFDYGASGSYTVDTAGGQIDFKNSITVTDGSHLSVISNGVRWLVISYRNGAV